MTTEARIRRHMEERGFTTEEINEAVDMWVDEQLTDIHDRSYEEWLSAEKDSCDEDRPRDDSCL